MYTNLSAHGGKLSDILDEEFSVAKNVSIASGYVGLDVVNTYKDAFLRIAKNGGESRLLLGMAFYEGLSQKKLDAMNLLNDRLSKCDDKSGVYVTNGRRYHGKVYHFHNRTSSNIYVGSSNFSSSGLAYNIECTVPIIQIEHKQSLINFINTLYSPNYSVKIGNADIAIQGKKKVAVDKVEAIWKSLDKFDPKTLSINEAISFDYSLSRIVEMKKSNLNVYFGKGRLNRISQVITPRPWYEIELIATAELFSKDIYPKGDFELYTDDGYIIPMRTQGDFHKNMRSKESLQIFGIWLKGKLEKSGALNRYQPVTHDTLLEYGTDKLIFYKFGFKKYFVKF